MRVSTCTAGRLWIVAAGQFAGAGEAVSGPECAPALCVPGRAPCGSVTGRAEEGSVSEEFRCLLRSELSQSGDAHETRDVRNDLVRGCGALRGGRAVRRPGFVCPRCSNSSTPAAWPRWGSPRRPFITVK